MGAVILGAIMAAVPAAPAAAADDDVSCRASAARVQVLGPLPVFLEPVVANNPDAPCADEDNVAVGPANLANILRLAALEAHTDRDPDSGDPVSATANARTAGAVINLLSLLMPIKADVLTSAASVRCVNGAPVYATSGSVANVVVKTSLLSKPITINGSQPVTINIPLVGKLYLNRVTSSPGRITRQALFLDTLLTDVVISESTANVEGTPCAPVQPKPECSDGVDNGDAEDTLADAADPGCLSGPGGSYDPNDPDETDPAAKPECSDGVDNDDAEDTLADALDPGCLSGPEGSYDPNDPDESNDPKGGPECSDGIDNDGDGLVDHPQDGACSSPTDPGGETGQCQDGVDNGDNEDTLIDMADPGCQSPTDNNEADPQCLNGKDDDGDGKIDHPADPGCTSRHDNSEGTA